MKEKIIEIDSYYGCVFENKVIDQSSDTLVIILPGTGYVNTKPLLYYSNKIVMELGYDVLNVNYGFQILNNNFNIDKDEEIDILVSESETIINQCLNKEYIRLIFIGKSLGTIVQSKLSKKFNHYKQLHVYLTPTNKTLENSINYPCLVVTGTADSKIDRLNIEKMKENRDIELVEIDGGNHSLEVLDILKSIEMLNKIMRKVKNFLVNNM